MKLDLLLNPKGSAYDTLLERSLKLFVTGVMVLGPLMRITAISGQILSIHSKKAPVDGYPTPIAFLTLNDPQLIDLFVASLSDKVGVVGDTPLHPPVQALHNILIFKETTLPKNERNIVPMFH